MLSASHIRSLPGDAECLEALAWLAEHSNGYGTGGFTPPLSFRKAATEPTRISSLSLITGTRTNRSAGSVVREIGYADSTRDLTCAGTDADLIEFLSGTVFTHATASTLFVTSGARDGVLDVVISHLGTALLARGYTLQPFMSAGYVGWLVVRKGRRKWTVTSFERATGCDANTGHTYAVDAGKCAGNHTTEARFIYCATDAVAQMFLSTFGVALAPTAGMLALSSARGTLNRDLRKWRPPPLLVAMEREGKGYRGGITNARRWRGSTVQVDITRQYSYAIAHELPHEWSFGGFPGFHSLAPGVYVCRVRGPGRIPYPIGVYVGGKEGFRVETISGRECVCILHTPEIRLLIRGGCQVWPDHGYTATSTFSFGDHVGRLQAILKAHGRDSAVARLTKPLGNYLYGKLAQSPHQRELMFSADDPGDPWSPYFDNFGAPWETLWERNTVRYSASQHIDVAAYVTALARAQTCNAWLTCLDAGAKVVRVHTDSLTLDRIPSGLRITDGNEIGAFRIEAESGDTVIAGPNAYADDDGAYIAGIDGATREMVVELYERQFVQVQRRIRSRRSPYNAEERIQSVQLRASAT